MKTLTISSHKKDEVVDITDIVESQLREMQPESGLCTLFVAHTTSCITTADLDPGTDQDLLDALRRLLPKMSYRHPHDPLTRRIIFFHRSSVHRWSFPMSSTN